MHICSIEAYPIAVADAAQAHAAFPELRDLSARLRARWPVRAYAPQRLWFPEDGFALTLHTGDVGAVLASMIGAFDAWFLDGFSPARNPDMWGPEVLRHVARCSAAGARLATFTVAGEVRRGLESVGFSVAKAPGFGAKRERLEARFRPLEGADVRSAPKRVAIIGAGIAGASCAHALAHRSVETVVVEAGVSPAVAASGNPAGLVMPRLDRGGPLRSFFLAAYLHAVATYEQMGVFQRTGVEQRAEPPANGALADLARDPPLPPQWMSACPDNAILHLRAGLLRPAAAIEAMLRDAELLLETKVQRLERAGDGWILRALDGRAMLKADAIVLACGAALTRFAPASFLPIALSRGQLEWGPGRPPAHAITQGAYVAPFEGGVLFGATFDRVPEEVGVEPDLESRSRNMAALAKLDLELAASVNADALHSRASLRATTPDRAPIAGLLPDASAWPSSPLATHERVYVLGGLGARGLTLAPLLGEHLASEMCGEPSVLSQTEMDAVHPARFLLRKFRRGG